MCLCWVLHVPLWCHIYWLLFHREVNFALNVLTCCLWHYTIHWVFIHTQMVCNFVVSSGGLYLPKNALKESMANIHLCIFNETNAISFLIGFQVRTILNLIDYIEICCIIWITKDIHFRMAGCWNVKVLTILSAYFTSV